METKEIQELLQAYVQHGSESAFRDLVQRYLALVYSTAFRQLGGRAHLAEDVAQSVFTDLARKARTLPSDVLLGGWLHKHTCFVATNVLRSEHRRTNRETQAAQMNAFNNDPDENWKKVAPVLDDAINELAPEDRDAVMLRYFEQRDFHSIGATLGVSDDTAQKRVSRAVEKLRDLLVNHGTTLSAAALATLLVEQSVASMPSHLAENIAGTALTTTGSSVGAAKFFLSVKMGLALLMLITLGAFTPSIVSRISKKVSTTQPETISSVLASTQANESNSALLASENLPQTSTGDSPRTGTATYSNSSNHLLLTILSANSGRPIPNATIDFRVQTEKWVTKKLASDRSGVCEVEILPDLKTLQLTTQIKGFADTRLSWNVQRGEKIPAKYTLSLERAVLIGGRVIDPNGNPAQGAKVGFNHVDDLTTVKSPESHEFGWIETETDSEGRWQINRIASEMIRRLYGQATHSNFAPAPMIYVSQNAEVEKLLNERAHVFGLGEAFTIDGIVMDSDSHPIADAIISVGVRTSSERRKITSQTDGRFTVKGCIPGENLLTVKAQGFAPATEKIQVAADSTSFKIRLQRGKQLLLKVINQRGEPVANAIVGVEFLPFDETNKLGTVQMSERLKVDSEGRTAWTNAPDARLICHAEAPNYMRGESIGISPDAEEHVLVLVPALNISGSVLDENGNPIPRFKIVCGFPEQNGSIYWSDITRFHLDFVKGKFNYTFHEGVAANEPRYAFKFEAEGYEEFISQRIQRDEEKVVLNVVLKKTAASLVVTVLLPNGQPAAGADIGFGHRPGNADERHEQLCIGTAGFNRIYSSSKILQTDSLGRFRLPSDNKTILVVAANGQGYAEMTPMALRNDPVIRLRPWGKIEGVYRKNGKVTSGRELRLDHDTGGSFGIFLNVFEFRTITDTAGKFTFSRVPPCALKLSRSISSKAGMPVKLRSIPVEGDETINLEINDVGYFVSGRLRWPDGYTRATNTFVSGRLHTPYVIPPTALKSDPARVAEWWQNPEVQKQMENALFQEFSIVNDQITLSEEIPPGDYILEIFVANAQGPGNQHALHFQKSVNIPSEPPTGALDLGEIELSPR